MVLLLLTASAATAQSVLCVEYKGQPVFVEKIRNGRIHVMDQGKLVSLKSDRCVLAPAHEYLPAVVEVKDIEVKTSYVGMRSSGGKVNNEFHFRATFQSQYLLEDAYLVLELEMASGNRLFYREIGTLTPGKSRSVEADLVLSEPLGPGGYILHVFTSVREVFNSEQPWTYREAKLDEMVRRRIEGVENAPPKPYYGPMPAYPSALRAAGMKGEARVRIRITPRGVVADPEVESATDPAFGEAALVAARQWRFLPKMVEGEAVEAKVTMPFGFEPPAPEKN